jgi:hypothetical protein
MDLSGEHKRALYWTGNRVNTSSEVEGLQIFIKNTVLSTYVIKHL